MSTEQSANDEPAYWLSHRPTEDTDPLHDLGSQGTIPPDVYEHPEWYAWGEPAHIRAIHRILRTVHGKPDALVTIYRAVPHGVSQIRSGDWVAITEAYARQHAAVSDDPADDMPVIAAQVPAGLIRTGGGDIIEWGYWGDDIAADVLPAFQ